MRTLCSKLERHCTRLKAKPYDIEETAQHWWKDHQFLVPTIESEAFPPKSKPDSAILKLRTEMDKLVNHDEECEERINLKEYYHDKLKFDLDLTKTWHAFFAGITNCHMYPGGIEGDTNTKNLLTDLSGLKVTNVENFGGGDDDGTQFKLKLTFKNNEQALFKPIRFDHNYETDPNQFFFNEMERPNAEVAAFYLDKLLGFRRGVPTVVREFNIEDLFRSTPDKNKKNIKYFRSPAKNWCMIGTCDVYCDTAHAICADQKKIRGSVQAWLPLYIEEAPSPYSRNYTFTKKQPWQLDAGYCDSDVKHRQEFTFGRRLLDLVDLSIFDFLTGNQDRHSYNWFSGFDEFTKAMEGSFIIPLDNGRAFGKPHFDDLEILAPLTQCCIVRPSTVNTLLNFYEDETTSLGRQLEQELKNQFGIEIDPDRPILARKYFIAIDRRVEIVLKAVVDCVTDGGAKQVLMNRLNPGQKFNRKRVKAKKQELGNQVNHPESTHHTEDYDNMITRHKQNIEKLRRPKTDADLVKALNAALGPFLKIDKPCPNEIMYEHLIRSRHHGISPTWTAFYALMSNCHLYKKDSHVVENVIHKMKQSEIAGVIWKEATQFQSILVFRDRNKAINHAIFKPMRFGRNYETNPNHFYFDDFERHHAEIAAFHLDRLLGFRRVPPTVGRRLKVVDDLVSKMQPRKLKSFVSPVGNDCFYEECRDQTKRKYCDSKHPFCGNGKMIEGSVRLTLLAIEGAPNPSPYRKVYSEKNALNPISSKRTNDDYCNNVLKKLGTHQNSRRLPDLVDLHIFDFLTGMADTVHESYIFVTENGKAFGNPHIHDETILAPLTQCCIVRPSTVKTLLDFYDGEISLGKQLDTSLEDDPLYPILAEKYLSAINFRVEIILKKVAECLEKAKAHGGAEKVFVNFFSK